MRTFLAKHWFLAALAAGLGVALAWPDAVASYTRPLPPPVVIATALFLMAWTMPTRSLAAELRRPWAALWAVVISYGLAPLLGWLAGALAPHADIRLGLLLSAAAPTTLASCVLWTRLAGGNDATALLVVFISTLTSWLFTSLWLNLTTGIAAELDMPRMMRDLALTVALPVVLGQTLRLVPRAKNVADTHKTLLGAGSYCCVLAMIVKAAAEVGVKIHQGTTVLDSGLLLASAGLTAGLHLVVLFLGLATSELARIDRPRTVAVGLAGSQKTLPVALLLFERYYMTAHPLGIVPLLFYHVGQLILDTLVAAKLRTWAAPATKVSDTEPITAPTTTSKSSPESQL